MNGADPSSNPSTEDLSASGPPAIDKSDFFLPGHGASALLIHGLTGTPYEMRWLGEQLAALGIRVRGVRLAGHAGSPEDLGAASYDNWYESVVRGFEELRQYGEPSVVVGLSAGAVLAARLGIDQREAVAGVAMLAPAFFLPRRIELALRAVQMIDALAQHLYIHNDAGSDIHDAAARRIHPTMRLMPLAAPINLLELSKLVRKRLDRLVQPTLLIYSRQDHTCPIARNQPFLAKRLGRIERREVVLEESYHVVTVDSEKQRVAHEVGAFIDQFRIHPRQRAVG